MASDLPKQELDPDPETAKHLLGSELLSSLSKSHCDRNGHNFFCYKDEDMTEGKCIFGNDRTLSSSLPVCVCVRIQLMVLRASYKGYFKGDLKGELKRSKSSAW